MLGGGKKDKWTSIIVTRTMREKLSAAEWGPLSKIADPGRLSRNDSIWDELSIYLFFRVVLFPLALCVCVFILEK